MGICSEDAASVLSPLDRELLALLRENSRRSNTELAARLNVSRTTIAEHIERLKDRGVIRRFTIQVAEPKANKPRGIGAFFHLKLRRPVCPIVFSAVKGWPELVGCWSIAGGTDMTVHVHCAVHEELEVLRDRLSRHPEIETLWTATILRQWAQRPDPELNYEPGDKPDLLDIRMQEIEAERYGATLSDGLGQAQ